MKLSITSAIALAAAISAAPAAAQYGYGSSAPTPAPTVPNVKPAPKAAEQGPTPKISKETLKAIPDLQKTVLANDFAHVPAKAQAAQAAAKTNEDPQSTAQLRTQ